MAIRLFANTASNAVRDASEFSDFVRKRAIKVTAEAWRAAMYLTAVSQMLRDQHFYMQRNTKDPPDFFGLYLREHGGAVRGQELEIEVFEVPNESPLTVYEEIEKKTSKAYSSKTVLVCQIRKSDFVSNLGTVREEVMKLSPKNEVWIIGGGLSGRLSDNLVAQVSPVLRHISIDINDVVNTPVEYPFIEAKRGRQGQLSFEYLGYRRLGTDFTLTDFEL